MPHLQLFPSLHRTGTIIAASGLLAIAVYYDLAWRSLKHRLTVSLPPNVEPRPWSALQYFSWGGAASILCFTLAAAADTPPTLSDHLVGALMGLCGVFFAGMFGFGLIALWNLWKESIQQLVGQLRSLRDSRSHRVKTQSLLLALPLAILGLVFGLAVFALLGTIVDKSPSVLEPLVRHGVLRVIAAMLFALWIGRSHAALLLRLILLVSFTLIMLAFVVWMLAWTASQTAPLLVTFLIAITILNAAFYARWIRTTALAGNFF